MILFNYGIAIGFPVLFLFLFRPETMDRLGPNGWIGIRLAALTQSKEAWSAGHRAAWPIIRNLCLASLFVSAGCLIGTLVTQNEEFGLAALLASVALVGFGTIFAVVPATQAAEAVGKRPQ